MTAALKAQQMLADEWGVAADVWSVTSWNELRRDAVDTEKWNLTHPGGGATLAVRHEALDGAPGPVIAVSDYMRAVQDQIAPWVGHTWCSLGTDGFGFADTRAAARRYFMVDAESIVVATLESLARDGLYDGNAAAEAFNRYSLGDPTAVAGVAQEGHQRRTSRKWSNATVRAGVMAKRCMSFVATSVYCSRLLSSALTSSTAWALPAICHRFVLTTSSSATPPAPMTSAAPGYQSHPLRLAWRNTPSLLLATPAMSIDADPRIRTVAAEATTDCHAVSCAGPRSCRGWRYVAIETSERGLVEQRGHRLPIQRGGKLPPTQPKLIDGRVVDRSQQRPVGVHQPDRRAPVRDAGQKVVRAVDRIDVPGPAVACLACALLPDQPVVGPVLREPATDAFLGCVVRCGYHVRDRGLVASFQALSLHLCWPASRLAYQLGSQAQVVHPPTLTRSADARSVAVPPPSLIQVSTTVSGLSEMLSIPC